MTAATTSTRTAVTMSRRVLGFTVVMLRARYGCGMHELRLFAISIDDVRDIFGAEPSLAARLRDLAAAAFTPSRPQTTVLDRIGPLFLRHRTTEVDPRRPLTGDVEAILSGGHIPLDRLPQCWRLLVMWLENISAWHLDVALNGLEKVEFELARAGLPSDFSLRSLAGRELGTPLRPQPEQVVGYSKHGHVVEAAHHLRMVHDEAAAEFGATMASIESVLSLMEAIALRPDQRLDLVVIQTPS